MSNKPISPIAGDRLRGAKAIADYIGDDVKHVQRLIEKNLIPFGREGRLIIASKRKLDAWWEQSIGGEAA